MRTESSTSAARRCGKARGSASPERCQAPFSRSRRSSTIPKSGVVCTSRLLPTSSTSKAECSPARAACAESCAPCRTRPTVRSERCARPREPTGEPIHWAWCARLPMDGCEPGERSTTHGAHCGHSREPFVAKKVLLAAPRSFCAGVDRAIEIVERLLEQHGPPVYVRHQIVHNDHVVKRLEGLGAVFVDHEDEVPAGAICVLSAHGVAPSVRENCERRGLKVVDAVCPLVSKVHAEARRYADSGHLVALVGHADHVEVIGTRGERPKSTVVIESPEDAARLDPEGKPVAVITQTTLSLDDVAETVDALGARFGDLRRPAADDICYATQNRQDAVKAMARGGASLILVIGSETR